LHLNVTPDLFIAWDSSFVIKIDAFEADSPILGTFGPGAVNQ
jgi:hypothetical protein